MADLTTPAEKAQIAQALLDAMNTLHQSPISLFVKNQSLDLRQINTDATYTQYDLKTIVRERRIKNEEGVEGSRSINNIEVKFHYNDFELLGLVGVDGNLLFNSSESYLKYKNLTFRVVSLVIEDIAVRIQAEANPIFISQDNTIPYNVYSMRFNGINQYVDCGNLGAFNFSNTSRFTLRLKVKAVDWNVSSIVMGKRNAFLVGYSIQAVAGRVRILFRSSTFQSITLDSTSMMVNNQWTDITITYNGNGNGTGLKLYINGTLDNTGLVSQVITSTIANTNNLHLGFSQNSYFNGWLDEFRVWSDVLSDAEILEDYNGGVALPPVRDDIFTYGSNLGDNATYTTSWTFPDISEINPDAIGVNLIELDRVEDVQT